jgi:hypothetical protein
MVLGIGRVAALNKTPSRVSDLYTPVLILDADSILLPKLLYGCVRRVLQAVRNGSDESMALYRRHGIAVLVGLDVSSSRDNKGRDRRCGKRVKYCVPVAV